MMTNDEVVALARAAYEALRAFDARHATPWLDLALSQQNAILSRVQLIRLEKSVTSAEMFYNWTRNPDSADEPEWAALPEDRKKSVSIFFDVAKAILAVWGD